jgi:hypothetical protein
MEAGTTSAGAWPPETSTRFQHGFLPEIFKFANFLQARVPKVAGLLAGAHQAQRAGHTTAPAKPARRIQFSTRSCLVSIKDAHIRLVRARGSERRLRPSQFALGREPSAGPRLSSIPRSSSLSPRPAHIASSTQPEDVNIIIEGVMGGLPAGAVAVTDGYLDFEVDDTTDEDEDRQLELIRSGQVPTLFLGSAYTNGAVNTMGVQKMHRLVEEMYFNLLCDRRSRSTVELLLRVPRPLMPCLFQTPLQGLTQCSSRSPPMQNSSGS